MILNPFSHLSRHKSPFTTSFAKTKLTVLYYIYINDALKRLLRLLVICMNKMTAIQRLAKYDKQGRYVFTNTDLNKIFYEDSPRAIRAGIQRLVDTTILIRVCNGVYVNNLAQSKDSNVLETIAKTIRRGEYNYVSLESALSEYGAISQIPIDRLTVMTTGRKGEYKTPFGTIEFTHTQRTPNNILSHASNIGRPLRFANKIAAYRDLKRVGRNTHLVEEDVLYED
jgi:hypothetical protein